MPENENTEATANAEQESATDESTVDWKAKAREWEKRAKQNTARIAELEPKASQYDALEQASKSELDLAREQANALQQELATTQRQALLASVALEAGLSPTQIKRLDRDLTTREELLADAEQLKAESGSTNTTRAPAPDRSQGSSANGKPSPDQDAANWLQNLVRH